MQIADIILRKQSDVAMARRKVHEAMMLLTSDVQRAAQFTGEFSDLARALTAGDMRLTVHVTLDQASAGRSTMQLALRGSVAGEERMRVAWTLCMTSHRTFASVPIPADLRVRMQRYLG